MGPDAVSVVVLVAVLCFLSLNELVVATHTDLAACVSILNIGNHQVPA